MLHVNLRVYLLLLGSFHLVINAQNEGYFWHVTDFHWDSTYSQNVSALSCNNVDPTRNYGDYGDYKCDPPWILISSSVHAMKEIHPDPDFIIWTGDDTPHIYNDTILDKDVVYNIITNLTDILRQVWPNTTIYSALGNHDWSPKHQLTPGPDPFYDRIADYWQDWLEGGDANVTFREGGFYRLPINTELEMLVLNTNLYYENNNETGTFDDPANQLSWMEESLRNISNAGRKALIIGHVPPGQFEKHANKHWFYPHHNQLFLEVLGRHNETIGSVHMGHHHTDSFRVMYDAAGQPTIPLFLAPAVTPWETTLPGVMGGAGNNPGIRLVKYDRASGRVLDIYQYYLDLKIANANMTDNWELFYEALSYYKVLDLSANSLSELASILLTDDTMFTKYYNANGLAYDPNERWTEDQRQVHYCAITKLNYSDYQGCVQQYGTANSSLPSLTIVVGVSLLALLIVVCSY